MSNAMALSIPAAIGSLESYVRSVNHFPILSAEEELRLAKRLRDDGDVEAAIRGLGNTPLLVIAGGRDRRMPPDVAQRLFDASTSPVKELLLIPEATHGEAFRADRARYLDTVFRFFAIIRDGSQGAKGNGNS